MNEKILKNTHLSFFVAKGNLYATKTSFEDATFQFFAVQFASVLVLRKTNGPKKFDNNNSNNNIIILLNDPQVKIEGIIQQY